MANNRPINRRPWRRPPWRKSRRPVRWTELNTNPMTDACIVQPYNGVCIAEDPSAMSIGTLELWNGDFDAEYADDASVVVERIVGNISVRGFSPEVAGANSVPVFRLGMLAVEGVEDIATWSPPNLFVREDLEEHEWMWLHQTWWDASWHEAPSWGPSGIRYGAEIFLDLRVKRKLAKKDHIVLLPHFAGVGVFEGASIQYVHNLRGLFSSK